MVTGETSTRYRILDRVAEGGMGEVYLAQMETLDGVEKRVALKLVRPHLARNEEFASLFIDEAKLAMSLSHGNVVHSFDVGRLDDRLFLAMEFVEGITLADLLATCHEDLKQPIPHRYVVYIAVEVLKGLGYAHRRKDASGNILNIVHRDVSPGNILISAEGEIKVADFGIAKSALRTRKTTGGRVKGKLPYVSPEQLREAGVDARTDLYALGAVMYEMLTDRWLVDPAEAEEAIRSIIKGGHTRPSELRDDIPEELERIVTRAIAINPEDRFPNAAAMRDALERFALSQGYLLSSSDLANFLEEARATADVVPRSSLDIGSSDTEPAGAPQNPVTNPFNALLGRELRKLDTSESYSVFTTDEVQLAPVDDSQGETASVPPVPERRGRTTLLLLAFAAAALLAFFTTREESSPSPEPATVVTTPSASKKEIAAAAEPASAAEPGSETQPAAETATAAEPTTATAAATPTSTESASASKTPAVPDTSRAKNRPAARRATSKRAIAAPGYLSINSEPWSYVSIDGKRIKATPLVRHRLKPGRYKITLTNPAAGLERTLPVRIKSGSNRRLRVNLREGS